MDTLRENKRNPSQIQEESESEGIETIGEEEKKILLNGMKTKLVLLKNSIIMLFLSSNVYQLIACPLFIYNQRPHIITSIQAVISMIIMTFLTYFGDHYLLTIYTSYILTVDYFSARIDFMMKGLKEEIPLEDKISRLQLQYNQLSIDFKNQNYLLKYLLRNMMYTYCIGLSILFLMFTVDMDVLIRFLMSTGIAILSLGILTSGLYIGLLHSKTLVLYAELNSMAARNSSGTNSYEAFKTRKNLLNCIKELGSQRTDGQFRFGIRDGHGPAISRLEMFQLTMATISNTLMLMEMVYH